MHEPTVAAGLARGLINLASTRGADPALLTRRSGLDPALLHDQDNRVPFGRYVALMREAKTMAGDPALALHYGEAVNLAEISILGLICHASATMADAFVQMNRYGRLVVEADHVGAEDRFQLRRRDGGLWLADNRQIPPDFPELVETTFALMVCGTRPFGVTPFVQSVHVAHADPGYRAEYERVLGAPVFFGRDWNAMQIDEAWLKHPIALQPTYVFGILSAHADDLVRNLEKAGTVRGRVECLLAPALHTGETSMKRIAQAMGMSRQTLLRRLKTEGATFEQVLDGLRRKLALHYLESRKVSVNETAVTSEESWRRQRSAGRHRSTRGPRHLVLAPFREAGARLSPAARPRRARGPLGAAGVIASAPLGRVRGGHGTLLRPAVRVSILDQKSQSARPDRTRERPFDRAC